MTNNVSSKRWHPFLGEWVIIAPVTSARPLDSRDFSHSRNVAVEYDQNCYLCPGTKRASGIVNPQYKDVFVFDNDFASLSMSQSLDQILFYPLDIPARGICRVVCFSRRHNTTLAEMSQPEISSVIVVLQEEFLRLSSVEGIQNVLIFENKGEEVGVSNHHPHGQIYATDFVPRVLLTEYSEARHHMELKGTCVFCDVLSEELKSRQRIVCQNKHFVAYVPYFARYPYEVHIIPRRHLPRIVDLTEEEQEYLAGIYLEVLVRYDNLFEISFPNITVFHNAPCGREYPVSPFHFHIEFCPPLRGPGVLKYMAGFETGAGNIVNPVRPEEAAASLRALSTVHYKVKEG